jgi:hypothetical protein
VGGCPRCDDGSVECVRQQPAQQSAERLNLSADDAKRIAKLHECGCRTDGKLAVVWAPAGALNHAETAKLIARLDKGVAAVRKLIGSHPWQAVRDERIVFYVSNDRSFVARANPGTEVVLMPLSRLRAGRAPFFRDAAHALLSRSVPRGAGPPDNATQDRMIATRPMWLIEGLAEYFGRSAEPLAGVVDGDPFDSGGLEGIDRTCAQRSAWQEGPQVLPFIGTVGAPAALFTTERAIFASIFYPCAFSFTKHLATLIGDPELIGLMDHMSRVDRTTTPISFTRDGVLPRIEKLTGKSTEQVRDEGLQSLPTPLARSRVDLAGGNLPATSSRDCMRPVPRLALDAAPCPIGARVSRRVAHRTCSVPRVVHCRLRLGNIPAIHRG